MTDLPANNLQPFQPSFLPTTTPDTISGENDRPKRRGSRKAAEPAPAKARKPRATRKESALTAPYAAIAKEIKTRKPKAAKTVVAVKAPSKLGINEIVSATVGLKEDEARQLLNMAACLDTLKKGARPKVMAALRKLFG